jgi:hypothetical protein
MSYVNSYSVNYTKGIFYLELRQNRPDGDETVGIFFLRPEDAKGLMLALRMMMDNYQKQYGEVEAQKIVRETGQPPKSEWKGYVA